MEMKAIVVAGAEGVGGAPLAMLEVLGRAPIYRVAARLLAAGVRVVTVIGDGGALGARWLRRLLPPGARWEAAVGAGVWRAAERVFSGYARTGGETVLLVRCGPYAEIDVAELLRAHAADGRRVTAVEDAEGELLGTFMLGVARRSDAVFLLRHQLQQAREAYARHRFGGYVNPLRTAGDLRQMAVDGFCRRARVEPEGEQVRPGVWIATGARVHGRARLLAPVFVGEGARVRAAAVLTRCTTVEHHAAVDCGTVLENTTVLPYTSVGAGLDVAHSVVGMRRVVNLRREVEVEVNDAKLVGTVAPAALRVLRQAGALAAFMPVNFVRGLLGGGAREAGPPTAAPALKVGERTTANSAVGDLP